MNSVEKGQREPVNPEELEQEIESPTFKDGETSKEERAELRERLGKEAIDTYLTPDAEDNSDRKRVKAAFEGKGLEDGIGTLLGTDDKKAIAKTLDVMGISRSSYETSTGKKVEQWRLRNPDPETKQTLPGSFANEEHLKAFLAGFVGAESFEEQIRVVHDVYEYLGMQPPSVEQMIEAAKTEEEKEEPAPEKGEKKETKETMTTVEEDDAVEEAPATPPSEAPPETADPTTEQSVEVPLEDVGSEGDEEGGSEDMLEVEEGDGEDDEEDEERRPVLPPPGARPNPPMSKWKSVFGTLGRKARMISFAVGMTLIGGQLAGHKGERYQPDPKPQSTVEMVVDQEDAPEAVVEVEDTTYALKKGDTVFEIVKEMLGERAEDKELLKQVVINVLRDNDIADESFGTQGTFDSTKLDVGMKIDTSAVKDAQGRLASIDQIRGEIA